MNYYKSYLKEYNRLKKYAKQIKALETLIGSKHIQRDFIRLVKKDHKIIKCIPLLLGVKNEYSVSIYDGEKLMTWRFDKFVQTPKEYAIYMREIGLFDLLGTYLKKDLMSYLIGLKFGKNYFLN